MKKITLKRILVGIFILVLGTTIYYYFSINLNLKEKEEVCFEVLTRKLADGTPPELVFQKDYENLQLLVEYSLVARSQMLEVSNRLRTNKNKPLSSRDLIILKKGT